MKKRMSVKRISQMVDTLIEAHSEIAEIEARANKSGKCDPETVGRLEAFRRVRDLINNNGRF